MTVSVSLIGGTVLRTDGSLESADLHIVEGVIAEAPGPDSRTIDCRGHHVLPGIVDVHGDAFELELHPRPGVDIAFPIAMTSTDRQLRANGITTAFHGLTLSWEPGERSLAAGRRFMTQLAALRPLLVADHRVQLRWETFASDAIDDLATWLGDVPTPALAFNDHTTATMEKVKAGNHKKLGQWAQRAGLTTEEYLAEVTRVGARAAEVPGWIAEVAAVAGACEAVMLSHDERTCAERAANRALGMTICEFPLALDVAADAVAHDEHVILGGPNVIRGGSHTGALTAEDAVADGLCTVLASDYYYPSLLHAVEHLCARGVVSMGTGWNLVSRNPAASMGLPDRGTLAPGQRGDVVVVDCDGAWRLVHTITGGAMTSLAA